jgi:hypothetical protein
VFDLIFCLKHHEVFDNIADVPGEWDYCIFGGDFNTSNVNGRSESEIFFVDGTDFDNLCEIRDYYHFDSANGGYLNWFTTHNQNGGSALDNILVSGNIMINSIKADMNLIKETRTDHAAIETTLTLLSQEDNPGIDLLRFPDTTYEGMTIADNLSELRAWLTELMDGEIQYPCVGS